MNEIKWEKNPDYPMSFGVCRTCGSEALVKLAWDLHGHLCVDAKACLARASRKPVADEEFTIPTQSELKHCAIPSYVAETVFMGGLDDQNAEAVVAMINEVVRSEPESIEPNISDKLQWFTCEICGKRWSRPSTRGRPPKVCPDCR